MKEEEFITVEEAESVILSKAATYGKESIRLLGAKGRVLAQNILADRDFPPFDRVTMDGIAINSKSFIAGQRVFEIEATQYAGDAAIKLRSQNACIEVMTGAILPIGTDSVVRYEDIELLENKAKINDDCKMVVNIHRKGSDRKTGELILAKGKTIKAGDLAVLATVGKAEVWVQKLPKVAIITSGDELIPVEDLPLVHQIRTSNVYAIHGLIVEYTSEITHFHLADNLQLSIEKLAELTKRFNILVISGGVSKGKKDHIPDALNAIGVQQHFHKVQQRPGKPFWFGTNENTAVFALPGNPVSSFMCAVRYLLPFLKKSIGQSAISQNFAVLDRDILFKPSLTYFAQVKVYNENGIMKAEPLEGGGSGDLANLSESNAFLELPNSENYRFSKAETFRYWAF